ncbi:MAG: pyruvate kinase [bacterium]
MEFLKTKIVCTLGPASSRPEIILQMIRAGMRVARLNFSHGDYVFHEGLIRKVRDAAEKSGIDITILQDLQGLKVRLGKLKEGRAILAPGAFVTLIEGQESNEEGVLPVALKGFSEVAQPGTALLLRDGEMKVEVTQKLPGGRLKAKVVWGGEVASYHGVNIHGAVQELPFFTDKDRTDLEFGLEHGVDVVALSYIRNATDVLSVRVFLESKGKSVPLIAKIERQEAVDKIDDILREADGVMIARGDLGLEMPLARLPLVQKSLISRAREVGRAVITATQMLESMINNPQPTRAETADVANAILDGTDAVMLSAETAIGKYPVEAVKVLGAVAMETETAFSQKRDVRPLRDSVTDAISRAAVDIALQLGAKAIVAPTSSGYTARMMSRFRTPLIIGACTPHQRIRRFLNLCWACYPFEIPDTPNTDETINASIAALEKAGVVGRGDLVVVTAGVPSGISGTTNLLKVHLLADIVARGTGLGAGLVFAKIGENAVWMDTLPEKIDKDKKYYLVRDKSAATLRRAKDMQISGIFAIKEIQPLKSGDEVTLNFDNGLIYRGYVGKP